MADETELAYLQTGFDLNSLTVPRLRNILVYHDISFPSSAKKSQLVELIESDLLPNAKKLLRERDRVRRTSKGITDVASQESTIEADEDDRELMPPPPAPKTPRSRKSKSNLADAPTPSTSRRSKTPSKRKSSSKARQSDTEPEVQPAPSAKKPRKSLSGPTPVGPAVRLEEPARIKREDASSPFSDDNPFQSGSSPPSESRRISSPSRSRKSTGRPSSSRRRETKSPPVKQEDVDHGFHASAYIPVSHLQTDEYGVTTTEEFAPDARRELEQDMANGQVVRKRPQTLVRRKKKPASTAAKVSPVIILGTVLSGIAAWYRQEKINMGYCGVGQPQWSLVNNENIPAWVHETLQPNCEPCPPHALCYPKMEVRCENDFILQHHPLSLNGLVPVPPTCEPDSEKEKRIKAVADKAIEELRERRAAYECGDELASDVLASDVEAIKEVIKAGETKLEIPEETLKQEVSKLRRRGMSPDEFEDLWQSALGDIKSRDEVDVTQDG